MDLWKAQLESLIEFEQSENVTGQKLKPACEYYKIAEAVGRVFHDEKSLLKKVKTDFELILKQLQFYTEN